MHASSLVWLLLSDVLFKIRIILFANNFPSWVRSTIISRSISATLNNVRVTIRPIDVFSIVPRFNTLIVTLSSSKGSMISSASLVLRANRSSFVTTISSPGFRPANSWLNFGRSRFVPVNFSEKYSSSQHRSQVAVVSVPLYFEKRLRHVHSHILSFNSPAFTNHLSYTQSILHRSSWHRFLSYITHDRQFYQSGHWKWDSVFPSHLLTALHCRKIVCFIDQVPIDHFCNSSFKMRSSQILVLRPFPSRKGERYSFPRIS